MRKRNNPSNKKNSKILYWKEWLVVFFSGRDCHICWKIKKAPAHWNDPDGGGCRRCTIFYGW